MMVRFLRGMTPTEREMRAPVPFGPAVDERELSSEEIYRRHAQRVARWVARLGGPFVDVEDLTQEVFLQVHRGRARFRGDCQLTTWLYRVTANVVAARRRKDRLLRLFSPAAPAHEAASREPTPVEALEQQQANAALYRALDRLRDKYRSVLVLYELEGLSGEQIADLQELTIATVWARLSRGRQQLARELERDERKQKERAP